MKYYSTSYQKVIEKLNSSNNGLTEQGVLSSISKHGKNQITKKPPKSLIKRIVDALFEPMLIILEIAMIITLGVNVGKFIKTGDGDFIECLGILFSVIISVCLTVYMEGKSLKAFEILNETTKNVLVKVKRNAQILFINQTELLVGDVVLLEAGNKIFADGRLISCQNLFIDESTLTGESLPVKKDYNAILNENTPLAERINCVFSGSFVTEGVGEYIVTAVGDNAEIGVIAVDLQKETTVSAPLNEKLNRLGKMVTAFGVLSAVFVLILTIARLFASGNVNFYTVQEAFLSSIILIVASVPEGLPTTVAIALTLNVVKLSKSNALIKKLVSAETVGCVSVICSDKTGTLTENKMKVRKVVCYKKSSQEFLSTNGIVNSQAVLSGGNYVGSATETAIINHFNKPKNTALDVKKSNAVLSQVPFSSENKYMITACEGNSGVVTYLKGAPEVVLKYCNLTSENSKFELKKIEEYASLGKRVVAFAHKEGNDITLSGFNYDGFVVISDAVKKDVLSSVAECKKAGISVKMLTGDNIETAYSIAKELNIATSKNQVINGYDVDGLSDKKLKEILPNITVIARSTPKTKLRIVTLLKQMGEVVAVTGDGVNDAPAIKHADIGISMGSGSEITKEASDIVLLDDSFSTIVKAISFGRNIYKNFQRFIMFQLSVNFSSVLFIVFSLLLGIDLPFTTIQILWINIIMDGPPALTLGLETRGYEFMDKKPIKRSDNIVTFNMFIRVAFHAVFVCAVLVMQYKYDFLNVGKSAMKTVIFSTFILFQLFNAFNARELGSVSVFKNLKSNKAMLLVFGVTFLFQVVLSEFFGVFFGTVSLPLIAWVKMILLSSSIVLISEIYKFIKRLINTNKKKVKFVEKVLIKNKNNA